MKHPLLALTTLLLHGCVAGIDPSTIPLNGSHGFHDFDDLESGDAEVLLWAHTNYADGELPAELAVVVFSGAQFVGGQVVIEDLLLNFEGGDPQRLIEGATDRSVSLSSNVVDGLEYSCARISLPGTVTKKRSFTIRARGYVVKGSKKIQFEESAGASYSSGFNALPIWTVIQASGA